MSETEIIQGRHIGAAEVEEARQLLAKHPDWSRWQLSRELARGWNWCNGAGQLKDMDGRLEVIFAHPEQNGETNVK